MNDLDGKPVDLGQYIGKKPVFLEFWATWCELCEAAASPGTCGPCSVWPKVEFIGVNVTVNQSPERVRRYVATHQPGFRPSYDDQGTSIRAYKVPATSYVVVVDRAGTMAYTGTGGTQDSMRFSPGHPGLTTPVAGFHNARLPNSSLWHASVWPGYPPLVAQGTDPGTVKAVLQSGPDVGQRAPDFLSLGEQDTIGPIEAPYQLASDRGKTVVVAFYPRDFTKGCTTEMRPLPSSTTACSDPTWWWLGSAPIPSPPIAALRRA